MEKGVIYSCPKDGESAPATSGSTQSVGKVRAAQ